MADLVALTKQMLLKIAGVNGPAFADTESAQEFKNKTIDFLQNTATNFPNTGGGTPTNPVTLDTAQTITGAKTFSNGALKVVDSVGASFVIPASVIVSAANYIIYREASGRIKARNGLTGLTDFNTSTAPTSAETTTLINGALTNIQTTGGLVLLKSSATPYKINGNINIGKSDNSLPNVPITLLGEGREATTIQFDSAATSANMLMIRCKGTIRGLGVDLNSKGLHGIHCNAPVDVYTVQDCALYNSTLDIMMWSGSPCKAERIYNNFFGSCINSDQCAGGITDYSIVTGNVFDKRVNAGGSGSSKTYGGASNIIFTDNVVLRAPMAAGNNYQGFGISIEGWNSNYKRVLIANNTFENGAVLVGGQNVAPATWDQVVVSNNILNGGEIRIDGGNGSVAPNNELKNVILDGNQVFNAKWGGLMITNVQGPTNIINNIVGDNNQAGADSVDRSNIAIKYSNDINIANNIINMKSTATNVNRAGIWADHLVNGLIHDNKIINATAFSGYSTEFGGNNTNVQMWDNDGFKTNNEGVFTTTASGATYTISHGLGNAIRTVIPIVVLASASNNGGQPLKVQNFTTTTFDVVYNSAPTGTINIYWYASKRTGL